MKTVRHPHFHKMLTKFLSGEQEKQQGAGQSAELGSLDKGGRGTVKTGYELVWIAGERTPHHLALVDDRTDRKLTYRELLEEVDIVAAGLAARVRAGSRIATILPNLFEHCIVLLALSGSRAVPALMNARLRQPSLPSSRRRARSQGRSSARIRFGGCHCGRAAADKLLLSVDGAIGPAQDFAACRGDPRCWRPPKPDPEDTAFIFYTSGTTGLPKGVVITHRTTEHRLVWLSTQAGLRHGTHTRTLGMVPISHAIGFYGTFLVTLAYNGTFYTMSAFNPVAANDLIERHKINYLFSVPTLYQAIVSAPNYRPERMASLELVLYGGAPISPRLARPHRSRMARDGPAYLRHDRNHVRPLQSRSGRTAGAAASRLLFARARRQQGGSENDIVKPGNPAS